MSEIAQKQRRRSTPVTWFPLQAASANGASLAGGAQVAIVDEAIDHPTSGEDYGPGAIVGMRLWVRVNSGVAILAIPFVVIMVLPVGLTAPTVNTITTIKQNEKYVWAVVPMLRSTDATAAVGTFEGFIHLGTVRRFDPGDRIVGILVNQGSVAFGAGATEAHVADMYLRED